MNNPVRLSVVKPTTDPPPAGQALYEKQEKIYPREVRGPFTNARIAAVIALLGIFYATPWLTWDGRQAVLFDLPARKFHIFALTLWPQDFLYLAFLLMLAALSLFFFTALAGRLWCGYACPQTVWTESFMWIERLVEGSRSQQMRLDREPFSWRKLRLKTTKHALWIAFAAFTGFSFVAYFTPAHDLARKFAAFDLGPWEWFWLVFYGFATYGNAGFMREQVCKYMCPYARFQGVMFDNDTLVISYDEKRGEPRGSRKVGSDARAQGLGDCVGCTLCVQVCPTGIDIREGLQYECIGCAACIDVCNDVMDKMSYPRGLIRYTTQRALDGGQVRVLRPRIVVYGLALVVLCGLFVFGLSQRSALDLDALHDRNQLYREVQGRIENVYQLKIVNKTEQARRYALSAEGIPGLAVHHDAAVIEAGPGAVLSLPVSLRAEEGALAARSTPVRFILQAEDDPGVRAISNAKFLGPAP